MAFFTKDKAARDCMSDPDRTGRPRRSRRARCWKDATAASSRSMSRAHGAEIAAAVRRRAQRVGLSAGTSSRRTAPPMRHFSPRWSARTDIVPFAVIDKADGKAKGHLWLMEIRPAHGVFEVGFITYSPRLQRTPRRDGGDLSAAATTASSSATGATNGSATTATSRPSARRCATASSTKACSASIRS